MKQLKLVLPTSADEQEVWGYRKEFLEQGSSLDGSGGLAEAESFAQWYSKTLANRSEQTVCPGLVPATTFLAVDADGKLIGMIDIRHRLNEGLLRFGGNIGYSVRPCCRRQGYATQMLALALEECRKMQMQKVLVTCNKENIGSAKTIQKNGGVLENEVAGKRERRGPHHPALLDYPVIRREKTGLRPFGSSPVFFTCADACAAPARCPDRRTSQDRQDR